jgi:hypothetical protein
MGAERNDVLKSLLDQAAHTFQGTVESAPFTATTGEEVPVVLNRDRAPLLCWLPSDAVLPAGSLRNDAGDVLATLVAVNGGYVAVVVDAELRPTPTVLVSWPGTPHAGARSQDPLDRAARDEKGKLVTRQITAVTGDPVRVVVDRAAQPILTWAESGDVPEGALRDKDGRVLFAHLAVGPGFAMVPVDERGAPLAVPVAVQTASETTLLNRIDLTDGGTP